ncbi:MAG: transpeptidase family protein [Aureispira sp.]|nr:transpeptidase family protein [Aureispira sp.]
MANTAANKKNPKQEPVDAKNAILWRIYVVMLIMIIGALVIVLRVGSIQYIEGAELKAKADSMYLALRPVEAPRGNILASDGSLLATSLPYFELRMDMKIVNRDTFLHYLDTISACLARYIDSDYTVGAYRQRLARAYDNQNRYFLIRRNVSYLELQRILSFPLFNKNSRNESGLIVEKMSKRQYPFRMLAHRTIGYSRRHERRDANNQVVVIDGVRQYDTVSVGLENSFEHILAGEAGERLMQRIGNNIWIPINDLSRIEPRAGKDIVTTIDINIQDVAESALLNKLKEHDADHGCVVVMEVETGQIKAIANIGKTGTDDEGNRKYWEDYNYAVAENAEPGSTFKLVTMLALFEDGYVTPSDTINLNRGKIKFYDEELEDAMYHNLAMTTVGRAFEVSSNVGMAKLTNKYYNKSDEDRIRFIGHLKNMFLDRPTGIEIKGERDPFIKTPDRKDWSGITIPWMSFGYELELSPIQQLTLYNAVANDGRMMRPHIVKEIRSYGIVEEQIPPDIIKRRIVSEQTIIYAKELLERVVKNGTAKNIKSENYGIAGKTGTTIMNYKEHKQKKVPKRYRSSFAGYFPTDNPKYSCIVVVTNPRANGYGGGTVAAPVFKAIADNCYARAIDVHEAINKEPIAYSSQNLPDLQVGYKPDLKVVMEYLDMPFDDQSNTIWTVGVRDSATLNLLTRNFFDDKVPNVVGMGLRDALFLLENRKLRVNVVGSGKVKSQSVKPGRNVKSVQTITLVLG